MTTISRFDVEPLLRSENGKIFSADFIKVDGSFRTGSFRLGVKKHVTGKGLKFDPKSHGLITVFDMAKRGYRSIAVERLLNITVNGQTLQIV